jgi:streptogramin lyase
MRFGRGLKPVARKCAMNKLKSLYRAIFITIFSGSALALGLIPVLPSASAAQVTIQSAFIPAEIRLVKYSMVSDIPLGMVEGAGGKIYFSMVGTKGIGVFNTITNSITVYYHPITSGSLWWIQGDAQGRVWYVTTGSASGDAVGYFDPATQKFTEWTSTNFTELYGIDLDPATGGVWFASRGVLPSVFRLTPATNTIDRWRIGSYAYAQDLTLDSLGNVWITVPWIDHSLLRLNPGLPSNQLTAWQTPSDGQTPFEVRASSSGSVWFSEYDSPSNSLARLDPSDGKLYEFTLPDAASYPSGVELTPDQVWLNLSGVNQTAVIDQTATVAGVALSPQTTTSQTSSFSVTPSVSSPILSINLTPPPPNRETVTGSTSDPFTSYAYPANTCNPSDGPFPFQVIPSGKGGHWLSSCAYLIEVMPPVAVYLPLVAR